jgi:hypothetical protein
MKILSIDVGIKNLAFCLFERSTESKEINIIKWDVVDISEEEDILLCVSCVKTAKYKLNNDICYCLKHSKNASSLKVPKADQTIKFITKQKIKVLQEIADKYNIMYDKKIKKIDLIDILDKYIRNHYLQPIETKKAADVNLFNIGLNLKTKFDKLFNDIEKIDHVIIENQIGPLAIRMKTIQGMLVQYFIMSSLKVEHIEFISSANKLKDKDKDKNKDKDINKNKDITTYANRKKIGVSTCLDIITTEIILNKHITYFNSHKKKDDLADSFLQGIWYINNRL